jgi:leader peptidase (prepilin peptidase)/N-methyltransferase
LFAVIAFIYGLLFGSFFNVLIYRLPKEQSIVFPASACPNCSHKLSWFENIPVLSFLFLGGKCKSCKTKISIQYPLIELATGIYSLVLYFLFFDKIQWAMSGNWWNWIEVFLQYFTLLLFIPLAIIDIKHYIIPDEITIPAIVFSLAVSFLPDGITPLQSIIGAVVGGGFLLLTGFIGKIILKKDAMGGGDIKFLAWIGALFGFQTALAAIFIGSVVGVLILFKKKDYIPFGPFLCAGTLIFVIFSKEILNFLIRM